MGDQAIAPQAFTFGTETNHKAEVRGSDEDWLFRHESEMMQRPRRRCLPERPSPRIHQTERASSVSHGDELTKWFHGHGRCSLRQRMLPPQGQIWS